MYKVLSDDVLLCDSKVKELALINPVVELEENKAGSFSFIIPQKHQMYDAVKRRKSLIQVFQDEEMLFSGICMEETKDFYKQKKVYCEGELTFFNDSVQRPKRYQGVSVRELLEAYVANHNAQVEERKRFTVGQVTVTDTNNYIYCYTNMESTMQCLKNDLVDDLGGFFRIRHESGVRYIDYLADSPNTNKQTIKFGENLLDFTSNIDSSDIATAIIPLGAKMEESPVEGLEARLTIESVNDGLDYVLSQEAFDTYGWVCKPVVWDDITDASNLKAKAIKYLHDIQFENMVIQAKAIDLHLTDKEIEQFKLSDKIKVVSEPHGLDRYFRLTKQKLYLNNPENNTVTLGKDERLPLSAKISQENHEIKKAIENIVPASSILKSAAENATHLIKNAMNGYITTIVNKDGTPKELLIMDTDSIETATKVWRWNINGLGYSSTGYNGTYSLAMTMDGGIVADFITTGNLNAERINGGELRIGNNKGAKGIFILDELGKVKQRWTADGMDASGKFSTIGMNEWTSKQTKTVLEDGTVKFFEDNDLKMAFSISNYGTKNPDGSYAENKLAQAIGTAWLALSFGFLSDDRSKVNTYYIMNNGLDPNGLQERHLFNGDVRFLDAPRVSGIYFMPSNTSTDISSWVKFYIGIYDGLPSIISSGGMYANGSLGCSGTKYRVVDTEHFGKVGMNAFETAEAYFADIGSGTIEESGEVTILFDKVFAETIDTDSKYHVFITSTSKEHSEWVEKKNGCFVVHGEPGATFDWIICCKQKGYPDIRMAQVHIDEYKKEGIENG